MVNGDPDVAREMEELIREYVDIFMTDTRKIGAAPAKFKFKIKLIEGAKPVKQNPRPLHPQRREALKKQLDDWIKEGVIEPSTSAWASPLHPVVKKDGSLRWTVDFRRLNAVTVGNSYLAPSLEGVIAKVKPESKVFSTLDCSQAYLSMEVEEESRDPTSFTTPFGLFRFRKRPSGC